MIKTLSVDVVVLGYMWLLLIDYIILFKLSNINKNSV